jgi:hypothetical protein
MTPLALLAILASLALVVTAISGVRAWLTSTADLKLSLFRPYRGDPWPHGVQEDDDFRFNWAPAAATASVPVFEVGIAHVGGTVDVGPITDLTDEASVEEAQSGSLGRSVPLERPRDISVRRIGR